MFRDLRNRVMVAALIAAAMVSAPLSALAQKASPVAPREEQVRSVITRAYEVYKSDTSGKNADYIPFLAQVDSSMFGVAAVSTDNKVFTTGEIKYSFSIQSISKVFTLALALEELGPDRVFQRIGSEPTGRAFNSPIASARSRATASIVPSSSPAAPRRTSRP